MRFTLPPEALKHAAAGDAIHHPHKIVGLHFAVDGRHAGQIGAAIAAALSGRDNPASPAGIGGLVAEGAPDETQRPASQGPAVADYMLFVHLDFDLGFGEVVYNGPGEQVEHLLSEDGCSVDIMSLKTLREMDAKVPEAKRLPLGRLKVS